MMLLRTLNVLLLIAALITLARTQNTGATGAPAVTGGATGAPAVTQGATGMPVVTGGATGAPAVTGRATGAPAVTGGATGTMGVTGGATSAPAVTQGATGAPVVTGGATGSPSSSTTTQALPTTSTLPPGSDVYNDTLQQNVTLLPNQYQVYIVHDVNLTLGTTISLNVTNGEILAFVSSVPNCASNILLDVQAGNSAGTFLDSKALGQLPNCMPTSPTASPTPQATTITVGHSGPTASAGSSTSPSNMVSSTSTNAPGFTQSTVSMQPTSSASTSTMQSAPPVTVSTGSSAAPPSSSPTSQSPPVASTRSSSSSSTSSSDSSATGAPGAGTTATPAAADTTAMSTAAGTSVGTLLRDKREASSEDSTSQLDSQTQNMTIYVTLFGFANVTSTGIIVVGQGDMTPPTVPPSNTTVTTPPPTTTVGANTTTAVMNVTNSTAATTTTIQPTVSNNGGDTSSPFNASSSTPYQKSFLIQNLTDGITFTLQVTTGSLSLHGSFCWNDSVGVVLLNSTNASEQAIFIDGSSLLYIKNKTLTNCPPIIRFGVQLDSDNPDQFYALVYGVSQSYSSGSLTVQEGNHPISTTTSSLATASPSYTPPTTTTLPSGPDVYNDTLQQSVALYWNEQQAFNIHDVNLEIGTTISLNVTTGEIFVYASTTPNCPISQAQKLLDVTAGTPGAYFLDAGRLNGLPNCMPSSPTASPTPQALNTTVGHSGPTVSASSSTSPSNIASSASTTTPGTAVSGTAGTTGAEATTSAGTLLRDKREASSEDTAKQLDSQAQSITVYLTLVGAANGTSSGIIVVGPGDMTPTTTPPPTTTTPTTTTPMMTVGANTTTAVMNVTTSTAATTTTTQPTITSNATYTSPNFTASSSNPYKQPILIQNLTVGITFTLQVTTGRLSLHGSFCWNDSVGVNILNSTTTSEQYIFVDGSSLQDIQNKTFTNCPPKPTFGVQLDSDNPDQFYALVYGVSQSDSSGSLTVQGGNHPLPTTTAATPPSSQNPPAAASSGLSGGAIAGIVIGAILIVAVIIIGGVLIYRNTTKARSHSRGTYEVSGEGVYRST